MQKDEDLDRVERIIREPEVRRITGLSRTTRWRLERAGAFPRRRRLSQNVIGWVASEIGAWLAGRPAVGDDSGPKAA